MNFKPFDGELDAEPKFAPFDGALDDEPAEDMSKPYIGFKPPMTKAAQGVGEAVVGEGERLRDAVFSGVDNVRAGVDTLAFGQRANRTQKLQNRLADLEARGQGDSLTAKSLRREIQGVQQDLPRAAEWAASAQEDAKRGSAMTSTPAMQEMAQAKSFGEAWEAFKKAPYDVISTITAQSMPAVLPALVTAAVAGPAPGALAMGASSGVTEAGSSLGKFASDAGVDVTDPKALQAFFSDPENLSQAMAFAGKRAGIIATADAVSGGVAGKIIAPAMRSGVARQAVNVPAQMGVQAGLGAGGEAGAQLATEGKISAPGEVLMEAVGELGGAPMEVATFGREARKAEQQITDPIAAIAPAQTVDEAIVAAVQALDAQPVAEQAVENIERILGATNVSTPPAIPGNDSGAAGSGVDLATPSVAAGVGNDGGAVPAVDARGPAAELPAADIPQPAGPDLDALRTENAALRSQAIQALESQQVAAAPAGPVPVARGDEPAAQLPSAGPAALETGGVAAPPPGLGKPAPALASPASMPAETRGSAPPAAPSARQVALDAERAKLDAQRVKRSAAAREAAKPMEGLSVGSMPTNAEPVSVKDGVVYIGKYPAQNFDTGADVTVPAGATPQQIADALKTSGALGKRAKFFGLPANVSPAQGTKTPEPTLASPEQQRADFAAAEKVRTAPGNRARSRAQDANPFKAFIAKHGITLALAGEFAPGRRERQAAMVQGWGPVFRKSGLQLDALAELAVQDGYLTSPDVAKLSAMITDALRGKRIIPQYAEGAAEAEMEARAALEKEAGEEQNAEVEAETQAEREAIQALAELSDESLQALAADDAVLTAGNNVSEADFLRALGASEQEIEDAIQGQERKGQDAESRPGPEEAAAAAAPRGAEDRAGETRADDEGLNNEQENDASGTGNKNAKEAAAISTGANRGTAAVRQRTVAVPSADDQNTGGLTAPTRADIEAKQDRAEAGARAEAKAKTDTEQRARADSELPDFTLTGSDRPADQAEARGQVGLFDRPASELSAAQLLRAAADKMEPKAPAQPITDFGEKIGGARKDVWTSYRDSLGEVTDDEIASQPLSKIWPLPDYQAMLDGGADPWTVAFMRAARDEIPVKPRQSWKVKRWAETVKLLRSVTTQLVDGTIDAAQARAKLAEAGTKSRGMLDIAGRIDLYMAVGHKQSLAGVRISSGQYSVYKGVEYNPSKVFWTVEKETAATAFSNWPRELAVGETRAEAIANFKAKYDSLEIQSPASKEVSFDIFVERGKDGFFIGKKIGRNIATLEGPFPDVKAAREYRSKNQEALLAKLEKVKEIPSERRDTNEPRVGEDMRAGQDATPQMFADAFGFRGVEFGNYVEQKKRQQDLNDAYDGLMDMAAILGIPPKAISLNGELGLAFGARGTGGKGAAAAHYERDFVAINLTKRSGAGSLGHEWWHAADNYFSRMRGKGGDYMTEALDVSLAARNSNFIANTAVRREMIEAFGSVVRAIKNTALKARSQKLDDKRTKEYWTTGREMAARAFESYLISKLQDQNASNDYLANIVDEATWKAAESMGFELDDSYPYPTAGEIPAIRAGFDHFFQTVQTKETDKGVAMFSRADTPELLPVDEETEALVQEYGEPVGSTLDAERRMSNGERIFAMHEQDDSISQITSVRQLKNWTPDQLIALPPGVGEDDASFARGEGQLPAVINPSTVANVRAAITELLGGKQLAGGLGRIVATTSAEIKSTWEPLIGKNVQIGSEGEAGVAQAFYEPGTKTIFMIADHINVGAEAAVLAHELMHKHGQAVLGKAGWDRLHGMIGTWKDAAEDSDERFVYDYATRKVQAVGEELSTQELFPYAVEAAIRMGIKPSLQAKRGTVASWLESVRQSLKTVWGRITGKPDTFRAQDLVDLAFGIAQMENPENAALQGALAEQTETPAFKKWFGDSKVVDAQGKPLIMFHGTKKSQDGDAFTMFDTFGSNYGLMGMGSYFTAEPMVASEYTNKGRGDSPTVYPVYLSIKNPIDMDAKADPQQWIKQFPDAEAFHEGGTTNESWYRAAEDALRDQEVPAAEGAEAMQEGLRAMGYDGIKHVGGGRVRDSEIRHRVYIAFDPEQIKSATGNRGTFDPDNADIRFSRATTAGTSPAERRPNILQRGLGYTSMDAGGRAQFTAGAWLNDKLGQAAGPMLAKLGLKAASPELRRMLRQMKLEIEQAKETAAAVASEATKLSDAERAMVSDLVEKELQAGTVPPAHAVRLAAVINDAMGKQTDELIRLGMLNRETADKWRGQYLPRFYESKLGKTIKDVWADSIGKMFRAPGVMKGIKGKHLKGRGLYQTIPEDQLADFEALGWEVRDPDYQPGLTGDGTVQVWRDFTRQERDKMGEIRDAGFRFVMGYMQTQKDIALGRLFEALASNPEMSSRTETEAFSAQVPETKVSGTGALVYGKMAGRWVSPETLSQLSRAEEEGNHALQVYRKAMSLWKEAKTVLNPVAHANNIISNVTMAHFAGVSYWRPDAYMGAIRDLASKDPMVKEAKDAGLFLGTMSDAELMQNMPEELKLLAQKQEGTAEKVGRNVWDLMSFWLRKPMGAAYQAEDTFFRYLLYRDARQRGIEPQDAVDYAQKYIFTYDDLPKGARMIRDFGLPFFAYTYKAVPALLNTALAHPERMAAPAVVLMMANTVAYAIAAGEEDDDWQTTLKRYLNDADFRQEVREKEKFERALLPEWNKGYTALMTPKVIRLGNDELTNLPLFLDMSRMMPGGDLFDVNPNAGGIPLPQPITPNHPLMTLFTGLIANKDLFRGTDLTDSNDTSAEKTEKRADWIWKQMSPAIALNNYHWERTMNALAQLSDGEVKYVPDVLGGDATGIGKDGLPVQPKYAAAQTFGIKVRPIDLETSELIQLNQQQKMVRDIDAEIRRLKRWSGIGAINDRTLEKELDAAIEKKMRLREGLTVDGEERN